MAGKPSTLTDTYSFSSYAPPDVVCNCEGAHRDSPSWNLTGSDSFTYYVTDNMGGYSMATVSVTIIDGPMVWIGTLATFAEEDYAPAIMNR